MDRLNLRPFHSLKTKMDSRLATTMGLAPNGLLTPCNKTPQVARTVCLSLRRLPIDLRAEANGLFDAQDPLVEIVSIDMSCEGRLKSKS